MVKIVWTDNAISDLNDIGEYISKDSVRYADLTVLELFESTNILEANPNAGPVVPEFEDENIRQIIRGSYRIIYRIVNDSSVHILTVHHSARLLSNSKRFEDL